MGEQDERVFSFHGRPAACGGEVPVSVIDLKGRGTAGVPDGEVQTHVFGRIPDAEGFKARLKRRCIRRAGQYEEREQEKEKNKYIYELPAGLIDEGETSEQTAIREMKEETGLTFEPFTDYDDCLKRPFTQNQGMSDECDTAVFGFATGEPSNSGNEASEDIEVVIADKAMVKKILKEEIVTIRGAYLLINFLHSDKNDPFAFLKI